MKFWRKYHKWAGLILSFFLFLFAVSGVILNHRSMLSQFDIPRNILSSSYQYHNWNNAALRGNIELDSVHTLFYGNVGCWQYNSLTKNWDDYNSGFPDGIDNRKISSLIKTNGGRLFAGTMFGLYEHNGNQWNSVPLNLDHPRVCDLIEVSDTLHILTRSELGLLNLREDQNHIEFQFLPTPDNYKAKTSLFKTLWELHSGEILGITGKLVVDLIALIFLFFSVTGFIWFISPSLIRKAKLKLKPIYRKKKVFRFSVKWHNKLGVYTIVFLAFTTFTGMFLRPPLLIAIANSTVGNIPFTMLDSPNAWYDQLRAVRFNEKYGVYLVSTNKGFYALTENRKEMLKIPAQAPVSVMGINVFEEIKSDQYLIGSFSGLYLWNPFTSKITNYINGQALISKNAPARPIGSHMATAFYSDSNEQHYFDYNHGAVRLSGTNNFAMMPESVIESSPLSLWNLALEIHTGRIFQDLIGPFYILIVPLVGLATLMLLGSGLWVWWKKYR